MAPDVRLLENSLVGGLLFGPLTKTPEVTLTKPFQLCLVALPKTFTRITATLQRLRTLRLPA